MLSKEQLQDIDSLLASFEADLRWKEMYSPVDLVPGELERCIKARASVGQELLLVERNAKITAAGH